MTVLSVRLDLTLSAHYVSNGSGSHRRMMSESPRKFNISTAHIVANMSVGPFVSTTVDMPYPNVLTYMLSTFSPPVPVTSFSMRQSHCITGSSLVFDDALSSFVWLRLCFAFDA